jgi:hypothetical protein
MADERLPLLRGRITSADTYESPRGGGLTPPRLPSLDPKAHQKALLQQLDVIAQQVKAGADGARDELAKREIIAVRPAHNAQLTADQLDDAKADARLVGVMPEGTVLLDVANADLSYLREKVDAFADDSKVFSKTNKDGSPKLDERGIQVTARASEKAIAPVGSIGLAELEDLGGAQVRVDALLEDRPCWFEIGCRGGYRNPPEDTRISRAQLARQLHRLGANQQLDEFIGPAQVYFFVRVTRAQLASLLAATDCVYEFELAPQPLRDLKLFEDLSTKDVADFALKPPHADAPSVVVLDTGIARAHPLLKAATLTATSVEPEIPSPEDTFGHGTKMAGIALYRDSLGAAIERGSADAPHWLQSSRLLVQPGLGTASDENYEKWPILTERAVRSAEDADPRPRNRAFVLAVTRTMQESPLDGLMPTLWSQAIDQLAFREGRGRLMVVSAGNARDTQRLALAEQHPQLQLSEKIHQPAQASNALTVGAFTARVELPNDKGYADYRVVATKPGGISPYTSTGLVGNEWPIKPDVVMEGGNLAISGTLPDATVPTLSALTTSHRLMLGQPVGLMSMTSEASARAAHLAARVWAIEANLRPETIRGLIVHSASWSKVMVGDFPGMSDRLLACGYGIPNERLASECAQGVATVLVEDSMPNAVIEEEPKKTPPKRSTTKTTEPRVRRKVKLYRLPLPESLLPDEDADVELRVTLSYFTEPKKFGRRTYHGFDLTWDMQGPHELEPAFLERINALKRAKGADGKRVKASKTKSFDWDIGISARSRGTVQSDRWRGKMSALVGDKLIAIVPVLGWWEQRKALRTQAMNFSLIVTVLGPGVYAAIKPRVEAEAAVLVEV